MRIGAVALTVALVSPPAAAEMDRGKCQVLAPLVQAMAISSRSLAQRHERFDLSPQRRWLEGEALDALKRLERAHQAMRESAGSYADAAEDLAYLLQRCAR
jgi:hypothetical protein